MTKNLALTPQIEFTHVLRELSVNRNDPCEIIRELISNSYDAKAKNIYCAPLDDQSGLIFYDDGSGLSIDTKKNGITPWEAFFSIGKSTKKKGDAIGYKCQGAKLCFACSRILVATRNDKQRDKWFSIIIDNPRNNLNTAANINPKETEGIGDIVLGFFANASAKTSAAINNLGEFIQESDSRTATLIIIDGLDTENFAKHFSVTSSPEESYIYNYIRFNTCHGDVRGINKEQGFTAAQINQVFPKLTAPVLSLFSQEKITEVPFGFPYLPAADTDPNVKSPSQISRLRDGRFLTRAAKSFSVGSAKYSVILAVDGNRRAHDEYKN